MKAKETEAVTLTVSLPPETHRRLKQRAQGERRSLDQVIIAAVEQWLTEEEKPAPASEYERTMQVIRESDLWDPMGPEWNKYIDGVPDVTAEEIRETTRGVPPVSEVVIAERGER
jgi:hypothetical protein